jgi:predicted metal-dependent peptidase
MATLTQEERITKAKIKMYETQPFFSYIVNHLIMHEDNKITPTMGVDIKGNCYYNTEFVDKLSDDELKTILAHESMHCALLHLNRLGNRDAKIWNYATDLAINTLLQGNNFVFPQSKDIKPILGENNQYKINKKIINDVDKKTAEMLYNELYDLAEKIPEQKFDTHIFSDENADGKGKDFCNGSGQQEDKWKQIITEATYFAKQKGNMSASMEIMVEKLLNKKLNWKQLLYRYITNEIQHDFTYARPSRKFISTGIYFPSTAKENIKVMAAIDTSGSIGEKELSLFLGEIYKITKSFNNMELEVLFHDTEISSRSKFNHSNLHKIVNLKATGGGGTSHKEVFEYVKKARPTILICFTDGYSDIEQCEKFNNTIFVLTDENKKTPFGKDIYFDRLDLK